MKNYICSIAVPVLLLAILQNVSASSESAPAVDSDSEKSVSREKRGFDMNRMGRGLQMLRLGKRGLGMLRLGRSHPDLSTEDDMTDLFLDLLDSGYYAPEDEYLNSGYYSPEDYFASDEALPRYRRSLPDDDVDESSDDLSEAEKRALGMLRLGKRQLGMLRLGKRPMGMLRLGKRPMGMLRLGKRPMEMLRLGKRPMGMLRLGKRPMGMLRLGKRPMGMLRLGKRPMGMLRLGKRPMGMLRLGKRPDESKDNNEEMKRALGMLRLGKKSVDENSAGN